MRTTHPSRRSVLAGTTAAAAALTALPTLGTRADAAEPQAAAGTTYRWRNAVIGDQAKTWVRINDDAHQWGVVGEVITGDPRVYGRVHLATNGRGIQYGELA